MIYQAVRSPAEFALSILENAVLRTLRLDNLAPHPVVFIIGPPRSGTTLLYQVLINHYSFAHFTNFTALFYSAPVAGFWLARFLPLGKQSPDRYKSRYGQTRGWHGPHEAGRFWYRWFPKGEHVYVPPDATPESSLNELWREVAGVAQITRLPLLFKNTYNSMRIAPIVEALPQAAFLVCQRDPVDTAQSILKMRVDKLGSKEHWWSVPPKEIDEIKKHAFWEQVVEQVYYTCQQIDEDRVRFGQDRFYDIRYKKLCQDTHGTLASIEGFLSSRGLSLKVREDVPKRFPVSTSQRIEDQDYQLIIRKVQELWG